jgi:hypothetical protein
VRKHDSVTVTVGAAAAHVSALGVPPAICMWGRLPVDLGGGCVSDPSEGAASVG